jgi:hypothetical protein
MPQLEHIEAIEKRLWTAAETLRANSNYASNEYFLPVMGLVFLHHAYSRAKSRIHESRTRARFFGLSLESVSHHGNAIV